MNDRRHSSGAGLVLREAVEARQEAPPTPVLPEKSIAECLKSPTIAVPDGR
jgi:hypothetical protein